MSRFASLRSLTRKNVKAIARMEAAAIGSRTFGEKLADLVATCVGSWAFLILQSVLLILWMTLNCVSGFSKWDPYPFVLLNLVLSFQAAFATPVILMSENRQARLSERRSHLDLQINLLAEQENTEQMRLLRLLCEKAGIQIEEPEEKAFEEATNLSDITQQIVDSVERAAAVGRNV